MVTLNRRVLNLGLTVYNGNGRGQASKFMRLNSFCPALESFVIPLSTTYIIHLKKKRVKGFADCLRLAP